jgi:chemotaxis protein MotB
MALSRPKDSKTKVPGWMVSFGDMMTLILTFFILLVSLSKERQVGLVAAGVGSFLVHAESFGLNGVLDGAEKAAIFNKVRVRFNLPPLDDPTEPEDGQLPAVTELVRAQDIEQLPPHDELFQPSVALFAPGSSRLSDGAREYLDLLAGSLRPGEGQVLTLEGQATAAEAPDPARRATLAVERARAVREHLLGTHGFEAGRVEARAWLESLSAQTPAPAGVDARLILGRQ